MPPTEGGEFEFYGGFPLTWRRKKGACSCRRGTTNQWLGFKGGKGVATYAGILFGLHWPLGLVYGLFWIGVLLASRISSLGGLVAAAATPIAAAFLGQTHLVILLVACSLIVFWKHRENIQRLMAGTEPRIGKK